MRANPGPGPTGAWPGARGPQTGLNETSLPQAERSGLLGRRAGHRSVLTSQPSAEDRLLRDIQRQALHSSGPLLFCVRSGWIPACPSPAFPTWPVRFRQAPWRDSPAQGGVRRPCDTRVVSLWLPRPHLRPDFQCVMASWPGRVGDPETLSGEDVADEEEAGGEVVPWCLHPCCQQVPPQTRAAPGPGLSSAGRRGPRGVRPWRREPGISNWHAGSLVLGWWSLPCWRS